MTEDADRHPSGCRSFDAPPCYGIGPGVQIDRDPFPGQHPEKVPKEVQRRGRQGRRRTAHQVPKTVRDSPGPGRRLQSGWTAGAESRPRSQIVPTVMQAEVQRRGEIGHRNIDIQGFVYRSGEPIGSQPGMKYPGVGIARRIS